jgi:hypothetical protein
VGRFWVAGMEFKKQLEMLVATQTPVLRNQFKSLKKSMSGYSNGMRIFLLVARD